VSSCWQDDLDVSAELGRYAQAYFGELHIAVRPLIDSVLYHLQCPVLYGAYHGDVDPLCREQDAGPTQSAVGEALEGLRQEAVLLGNDFVQLEQMASEAVRLRLRRWRLYVEYLAAYYNARSRDNRPLPLCDTPAPHDLVRWVAALPAECAMVNAPADFVDWRFDEFVARGQ